ncbi:MAG: hypothetical protein JXR51_10570 [Bacteroidales bacterium]|nr:hypothetical protein [Bacteroidales bacterium]MBN2757610.1 hypothetical protein [Bacteroidales bacterium]
MKALILSVAYSLIAILGFTDNQIWVQVKMPSNNYSGEKFTVEITVNKLDLKHFAEFSQKLPKGFTAIEKESGSAEFSFSNQELKFVWLRLPREPKFTISFDLITDKNTTGTFNMQGLFTYIFKNQRGTAYSNSQVINIYKKGEGYNFNKELRSSNISFPPTDPNIVQCLRVKPFYSANDKSLIVKLLVSRGTIMSAAKIEENIPDGYKAEVINSKGASFAQEDKKVLFVWANLPLEKNFEVIYKLKANKINPQLPIIEGDFNYLDGSQLFVKKIIEIDNDRQENKNINTKDIKEFFLEQN